MVEEASKLAELFFYESDFAKSCTLRLDGWKNIASQSIEEHYACMFCAIHNGVIIGYIIIHAQDDYTEEMVGELFQFYVKNEYRGTPAARMLVKAADQKYNEWDCVRRYAEASAGLEITGYPKVFENLWRKFGYAPNGITMMKDTHGRTIQT